MTASAGNHGQAVAWAAREAEIPATIVVPEAAPMAKVEAARGYGARVEFAGEGFDEAIATARTIERETGATFVHAFEDPRVIAGQGTLGLELVDQLPEGPGTVVVPVGGGGLVSGVAIALAALRPELRVVGVQAAACAPLAGYEPTGATIADGIAVKHPGELTGAIVAELVDELVVVDDEEISQALVLLLERAKLVVEGAGAAPIAALVAGRVPGEGFACAVLAGGNVDATTLNSVIRHGLTSSGRHLVISLLIPDRPGQLARVVGLLAAGAREHPRDRAPPRGPSHRRARDGGGADARDARRGALATRDPRVGGGRLHRAAAALVLLRRLIPASPGQIPKAPASRSQLTRCPEWTRCPTQSDTGPTAAATEHSSLGRQYRLQVPHGLSESTLDPSADEQSVVDASKSASRLILDDQPVREALGGGMKCRSWRASGRPSWVLS